MTKTNLYNKTLSCRTHVNSNTPIMWKSSLILRWVKLALKSYIHFTSSLFEDINIVLLSITSPVGTNYSIFSTFKMNFKTVTVNTFLFSTDFIQHNAFAVSSRHQEPSFFSRLTVDDGDLWQYGHRCCLLTKATLHGAILKCSVVARAGQQRDMWSRNLKVKDKW